MPYPALPTFPASTNTSFDDLMTIKEGQEFMIDGYHYVALGDATATRRHGFENIHIPAKRRHGAMHSGWELATVLKHRTYVGTLDEILTPEEA